VCVAARKHLACIHQCVVLRSTHVVLATAGLLCASAVEIPAGQQHSRLMACVLAPQLLASHSYDLQDMFPALAKLVASQKWSTIPPVWQKLLVGTGEAGWNQPPQRP
jgi:hypothetical protein